MKRIRFAPSLIAIVALGATVAFAMGLLDLPLGPVSATHGPWDNGSLGSTIDITLADVPDGHDVMNGLYAGWCAEDNFRENLPPGSLVTLWDSTDDPLAMPPDYGAVPWDQVNYLLNHKAGTIQEIQAALWNVIGTANATGATFPVTPAAQAMIDDALANGPGFLPGPGQVIAVILEGDGLGYYGHQDTIIEVPAPPMGHGCTPGYWRNHEEDWPPSGLAWEDDFDATFGVNYFRPDITLGQAIWMGGGHKRKAARHGTAALLNALHPDVDYPYTVEEVIGFVQSMDLEPLVEANELGCNL